MKPETSIEFEGVKLEFIKESLVTLDWERRFAITFRITNLRDHNLFVTLRPEYISTSKGLIDEVNMSHYMNYGEELLSKSFVDVKISFRGIKRSTVSDGDRIKLKIPDIASLILRRYNSQWFFVEYKSLKLRTSNDEIKGKIEHFETIEERT